MSASGALAVLRAVDDLYAAVVAEPEAWTDGALASWAGALGGAYPAAAGRDLGKHLRRVVRVARKLASKRRGLPPEDDFRGAVDAVLGTAGWRPALDYAMAALDRWPDPELFAAAGRLFRVVNFSPWLDGLDYDSWLAQRDARVERAGGG